MLRLGYDPALGVEDPYYTTREQRTATIKMITAAYCGRGESFTESGVAIHWRNRAEWVELQAPTSSVFEAYWGEAGALCLDSPRLGERGDIPCAAELPRCSELSQTEVDASRWEWRTELPVAP